MGKDRGTFVCGGEITLNSVCFSMKWKLGYLPKMRKHDWMGDLKKILNIHIYLGAERRISGS